MAKLGEGDPRWIVSDRADGRNVNSWHWTEKDISDWARKRLRELLEEVDIPARSAAVSRCRTGKVDKVEGDCQVFNRKGKLSFLLDIQLSCSWEAELRNASGDLVHSKGKLEIPELDHDCVPEKLQVDVTCSDSKNEEALNVLRTDGREFVRSRVLSFLNELKAGNNLTDSKSKKPSDVAPSQPAQPTDTSLSQFTQSLEWRVPPEEFWSCLTHEGRVSAYTRAPAKIELVVGGSYEVLNGNIAGTFTAVDAPKSLALDWRLSDWPSGVTSKVNLSLDSFEGGTTLLRLEHSGVPFSELERTKEGWKQNFWEPIRLLFGYGFSWK
eukprot:NODE_2673_length_1144_cov_58.876712_g2451_i0.p1 GENE.NODE_2673_length_1144_cov_58.876712_g2451_i0~~NODE_2673_length_1144_cov_58.876712_g2451_i0.p1  ORF type:complete len:348 (+),score=81.81 NODE_2673_length_1144_cov_58.876712_g2451_i0:70-1044(+)